MYLPAIYIRYGQIVPFSRPLSLIVTDSPFLSGFPLRDIASVHTLNAGSLRHVSRPAHRGTGWLRLATLWHRPGRNRDGQTAASVSCFYSGYLCDSFVPFPCFPHFPDPRS